MRVRLLVFDDNSCVGISRKCISGLSGGVCCTSGHGCPWMRQISWNQWRGFGSVGGEGDVCFGRLVLRQPL
eukprot:9618647-Alexandrium_andersonii.AAC.1